MVAVALAMPAAALSLPSDPPNARAAVQRFLEAARSGDAAAVPKAAADVVACGAEAIEPLLAGLEARTPPEITCSLRVLREVRGKCGADLIAKLGKHSSAEVRAEALLAGTTSLGSSFIPQLKAAARDSDAVVRRRAWDGLKELKAQDQECLQLAADNLVDGDFWLVACAYDLFAVVPQPPPGTEDPVLAAVGPVVERLDAESAGRLFRFLVARCGEGLRPLVLKSLKSRRNSLVTAALGAAGDLGLREVAPAARDLATKPQPELVLAALDCLGKLRDEGAAPGLVDLLESTRDPALRDALAVALRTITGQALGFDIRAWRRYLDRG